MKKLMAAASYSFNNFYNNLNTSGQVIFSAIVLLIIILCILLFISYVIQNIKEKRVKQNLVKEVETKENVEVKPEVKQEVLNECKVNVTTISDKTEPLYTDEKTIVEDIAQRVSEALMEQQPINLTNFEEEQEKTAIISIDELMKRAKELELINDDENTGVNYLEKYNLESAEELVSANEAAPQKEVKAFKVSQVISPIYGVKKDTLNDEDDD